MYNLYITTKNTRAEIGPFLLSCVRKRLKNHQAWWLEPHTLEEARQHLNQDFCLPFVISQLYQHSVYFGWLQYSAPARAITMTLFSRHQLYSCSLLHCTAGTTKAADLFQALSLLGTFQSSQCADGREHTGRKNGWGHSAIQLRPASLFAAFLCLLDTTAQELYYMCHFHRK